MSVINQMLRDLEARKAQPSASNHYSDEVNIIAAGQPKLWWIILPVLLAVIISVNVYLHRVNQNASDTVVAKENTLNIDASVHETLIHLPSEIAQLNTETTAKGSHTLSGDSNNINKTIEKPELSGPIIKAEFKEKTKQPSITIKQFNKEISSTQPVPEIKSDSLSTPEKKQNTQTTNKKIESQTPNDVKSLTKTPVIPDIKIVKTSKASSDWLYQARLLMVNDQTEAIKLLEQHLHDANHDTDYYALLANLYQRQKSFDNAIITYKKALDIAPDNGELWIGIALAYQGTGEVDNAQMAFKRAYRSVNISPALKQYAGQQIR